MARIPSAAPADRSPASPSNSVFGYVFAVVFAASVLYSLRAARMDPRRFFEGDALANVAKFVRGSFPPQLSRDFLGLMLRPALETIQISVMGTAIAVLIGFPLGLLATSSLTWRGVLHERTSRAGRWLAGVLPYTLSRAVLSVLRSIPEYVWAFMFVRAVGLGPFPGVLAIGVAYGGMLGKVYSEILENMNPRPLETLHASGASRLGVVLASAILGFVGAGGLGQQIELSMRMFQFDEVLTLLAILFVLVATVDFISGRIRARLA